MVVFILLTAFEQAVFCLILGKYGENEQFYSLLLYIQACRQGEPKPPKQIGYTKVRTESDKTTSKQTAVPLR